MQQRQVARIARKTKKNKRFEHGFSGDGGKIIEKKR